MGLGRLLAQSAKLFNKIVCKIPIRSKNMTVWSLYPQSCLVIFTIVQICDVHILQDPGSLATDMLKKRLDEAIQSNNTLKKENGELKTKVTFFSKPLVTKLKLFAKFYKNHYCTVRTFINNAISTMLIKPTHLLGPMRIIV